MVNKCRSTYFDIPLTTWGTVVDQTVSGLVKLAARENAPNPRYLSAITDIGELLLFDKDGSKLYGPVGPFTGHGSPDELSINVDALVLIRSGTNLALINADGTVRWNKQGATAITNLAAAKIGQNYVCCFINTGATATSGVQWRSLTDGAIIQDVYGVGTSIITGYNSIAVGQTGERAAIHYAITSLGTGRFEHHHITSGRLWSVICHITSGGVNGPSKIAVDKDCGYAIVALKGSDEGNIGYGDCYAFDSTGLQLGMPWGGGLSSITYFGVCMSPDGKQAGGYADTTGPTYRLYRVIIVPYTVATTTLAAKGKGLDITDDDLYYMLGAENGTLYCFRVDGFAMGSTPYGGVSTPIAAVRNYT